MLWTSIETLVTLRIRPDEENFSHPHVSRQRPDELFALQLNQNRVLDLEVIEARDMTG